MTVEAAREAGETDLARQLDDLRDRKYWKNYAISHLRWVQEIGEDLGLPIHLWPDKELVNIAGPAEARWLQSWRDRQSPEEFANRDIPQIELPEIPTTDAGAPRS
jgi:hypothetical protein